jgi:hypothetical protein
MALTVLSVMFWVVFLIVLVVVAAGVIFHVTATMDLRHKGGERFR